jgi:hypothetical protein
MKKKLIAGTVIALATLTLSACSTTKPTKSSSSESKSASKSESKSKASSSSQSSSEDSSYNITAASTFDEVVAKAKASIPSALEKYKDYYSDMTVTSKNGNTLIYTYTFINRPSAFDEDSAREGLETQMNPTLTVLQKIVDNAAIQIIYLNPDGTELANFSFGGSTPSTSSSTTETIAAASSFDELVAIAQSKIPETLGLYKDTYSNLTITGMHESTLVYTYTLRDQNTNFDSESARQTLIAGARSTIDALKAFTDHPTVQVFYNKPDGTRYDSFTIGESNLIEAGY